MLSMDHGRSEKQVFRVERQDDGYHKLEVYGKMPTDWVGNLTNGIARSGLSIMHGRASREAASSWRGHFALECSPNATAPEKIDYLHLIKTAAASAPANLCIDSYILRPTNELGGSLYLEIRGKDQLGFLGSLLGKLSFYSLFPVQMEIETEGGRILDRFWLTNTGGGLPSGQIIEVLEKTLEKMLSTTPGSPMRVPFGVRPS